MTQKNNLAHIAIIMDGNRRWATARGLPKLIGHSEGSKTFETIVKAVEKHKIPYLTVYALSTENLNRDKKELEHLFSLFEKVIDHLETFIAHDTRFNVIGNLDLIPHNVRENLTTLMKKTQSHKGMTLTLAIAYGGRDEIIRATQKIIKKGLKPEEVTEQIFQNHIDTHDLPDVDLMIRTGGHARLSGFLPWQSTYAELYFTDILWPDFSPEELDRAIEWHNTQVKNKGK